MELVTRAEAERVSRTARRGAEHDGPAGGALLRALRLEAAARGAPVAQAHHALLDALHRAPHHKVRLASCRPRPSLTPGPCSGCTCAVRRCWAAPARRARCPTCCWTNSCDCARCPTSCSRLHPPPPPAGSTPVCAAPTLILKTMQYTSFYCNLYNFLSLSLPIALCNLRVTLL